MCGWLSLHHDIAQSAGMWPLQNVVKCIVHITLPAPLKVVCNENLGVGKMETLGMAIDILLTYDFDVVLYVSPRADLKVINS